MSHVAASQRKTFTFLELTLVPFVALVLRVINLDFRALWWDEGRNIFFSQLDWVSAAQAAVRSGDTNPPVYRMLLGVWMSVTGPSPFAVRALSVVMGVITVAMLYRLAADLFNRRVARIVAVMASISPALVYYSQEAKGYALVILAATLSAWLWMHIHRPFLSQIGVFMPSVPGRPWLLWPLFALATLLALGAHFFSFLFILVENTWAVALTWRVRLRFSPARLAVHWLAWIGLQVLAVAFPLVYASKSAAALLGDADAPFFGVSNLTRLTSADLARWGATTEFVNGEPTRRLLSFLWSFVEEIVGSPNATTGMALLAVAALGPLAYMGLSHRSMAYHRANWIIWMGFPVLLSAGFVMKFTYFYPRFLLFVLPAILVLSGAGLDWFLRRHRRIALILAIVLALSWGAVLGRHYVDRGDPDEDWRTLITAFSQHNNPGDLVVHSYDWIAGYLHSYLSPRMDLDYLYYVKGEEATLVDAAYSRERMWFMDYQASPLDAANPAGAIMRAQSAVAYSRGFGNAHLTLFVLPSSVLNLFDGENAYNVQFESGVELYWSPLEAEVRSGDAVAVELVWYAPGLGLPQYQVFLHVIDLEGRLVVGRDTSPVNDLRPTESWGPHERVASFHAVLMPPNLPPGLYHVYTGMYELGSGTRQVIPGSGDSVQLGTITLRME